MNKSLEKTIFLFFVHEILVSHKMALTWDGKYVKDQIIARLEGGFVKTNGHYKFPSASLTRLGKKYGLHRIDKIFQKPIHPRFDNVYRFSFKHASIDMKVIARSFESQRDVIFAEPNYQVYECTNFDTGSADLLEGAA